MDTGKETERPVPRAVGPIFEDIRALSQSDGALHAISSIIYRDWVITVDSQEGCVIDDPERRWSTSKLNSNELMLLLGLMVQSKSDQIYTVTSSVDTFVRRADQLLHEFHDRLVADAAPTFDHENGTFIKGPDSVGLVAREAIYYRADSFYLHQFPRFTRQRYRNDGTWLLLNAGLSIRPMIDIARYIVDRVNAQMTAIGHARKEGKEFSHDDLTNSLLIAKADVRKKFKAKADAFYAKFATSVTGANMGFTDPFAINAVSISPGSMHLT